MSLATKLEESRIGGTVGAAVTVFVGLFLLISDFGQGLEDWSYDLPYAFRPRERPQEVVLIYMDDDSHVALRESKDAAWDRRLHAQLLRQLRDYGTKAVAFDILFEGTTTNDSTLVDAARAHGHVVFGARSASSGSLGALTELKRPFAELRAVATYGVSESSYDGEFIRQNDRPLYGTNVLSLAWRVAELTHPQSLPDPLQPRWLNYYGPAGTLDSRSYADVWLGRNVFEEYRAVKIVHRESFADDSPYEREFEGIKRFDPYTHKHTGLLSIFHVGRNDQRGYFFYIMELADDSDRTRPFDPSTYEANTLALELKRRRQLPVGECIQVAVRPRGNWQSGAVQSLEPDHPQSLQDRSRQTLPFGSRVA